MLSLFAFFRTRKPPPVKLPTPFFHDDQFVPGDDRSDIPLVRRLCSAFEDLAIDFGPRLALHSPRQRRLREIEILVLVWINGVTGRPQQAECSVEALYIAAQEAFGGLSDRTGQIEGGGGRAIADQEKPMQPFLGQPQ